MAVRGWHTRGRSDPSATRAAFAFPNDHARSLAQVLNQVIRTNNFVNNYFKWNFQKKLL